MKVHKNPVSLVLLFVETSPPPFFFPRVHGSYEQLWAGQVADALVDLTGGIAERWTLKGPERNMEKEKTGMVLEKAVFRRLMNLKEQCVISCSVLSSRQGNSKVLDILKVHVCLTWFRAQGSQKMHSADSRTIRISWCNFV